MAALIVLVAVLSVMLGITLIRMRTVVAERNEARAAAEHAAGHDPLTHLATRALFTRQLDDALATGATGAVLVLDLDHLPRVNDVLGHEAGDEVLVEVADRLRSSVRTDDLVARLSGGEFVVLLRTDPEVEIFGIAERVIEVVRVRRPSPAGDIDVSARVGMVQWDESTPPASAADLLRSAESAMHAPTPAAPVANVPSTSTHPAQTTHRSPVRTAS